jgi:hypothetical protein
VLRRHGFQDDAVAEGLELGDRPLTLAVGVAPDEVVATQVLVVAVVGEQMPGDDENRVPDGDRGLLLADASGQPVGASYSVTSGDLRILMDQPTEAIPS